MQRNTIPSLRQPLLLWMPLIAAITAAGCAAGPPHPSSGAARTPAQSTGAAHADSAAPADEAGFAAWLAELSPQALAAGIRPDSVRQVLGRARLLPRVLQLEYNQPEFSRPPWTYLDGAVSAPRIAQGQVQRAKHRDALDAAAARYGVPAPVLTAIWGMESDYGRYLGTFRTVDALATLAYAGRRRDWARTELLAALRIIDQGDIAAEAMLGSWAGAMGHTQFLPSVYLAQAVDADGDGRRDIWGSIPDVAASTARFLADVGWQTQEPWGCEIRLPDGFDHARAESDVRQSAEQWAAEGLRGVDGQALPALASAAVIEPAGARGPAFLVGQNFRSLLRYNNSTHYALAVALLAQRIDAGPGVVADWPRDLQPLSRGQMQQLQTILNAQGYDSGASDGVYGPATRAGLRRYQQSRGQVPDGYPTLELLQSLQSSPGG
ncbi:lytic murein transglycosylase [Verminephrobacter aporrectodeae subsp. tuberculatae]|uniref:lytic murein transglycosylase n=1 Tax=Verminephrobacter aporrectodeae TaxID=1110389 RepID=UPI002237628A|nr:lytic murein transglycosylase [Verminephrobacter aporrectodeae]MCW5221506.1 lytic murein transglycosylase [Verminephrobacter aporrectodeae subsp. tuberculatae]MCW5290797.1 lytic murein transglycosylase [Verminephrobacter aporrectodeae subsp. tuberculatae]